MYKEDLALNNLQGLICPRPQPNQIIYIYSIYNFFVSIQLLPIFSLISTKLSEIVSHDWRGFKS